MDGLIIFFHTFYICLQVEKKIKFSWNNYTWLFYFYFYFLCSCKIKWMIRMIFINWIFRFWFFGVWGNQKWNISWKQTGLQVQIMILNTWEWGLNLLRSIQLVRGWDGNLASICLICHCAYIFSPVQYFCPLIGNGVLLSICNLKLLFFLSLSFLFLYCM